MSWHEKRFEYSPTKVHKNCLFCNRDLYFPLSKSFNRNTCGEKCAAALKAENLKKRAKNCLVCGKEFTPRTTQILSGGGKHEKGNIQLLCPSCNVNKSAKDPISYMQQKGFLL